MKTAPKDSKPKKNKNSAKRKYINGLCKFGKYWWVCVKRKGIKIERSTGCTNRQDAEVVLEAIRKKLGFASQGIATLGPFDTPSLEEAAVQWHAVKEGHVSERYREQLLMAVRVHMAKWKHMPLHEITNSVMEEAVHQYSQNPGTKTLKGKTYSVTHSTGGSNRLIRLISALFGWAVKTKKWMSIRPWDISEEAIQEEPRAIVWPEQVQEFLRLVNLSTRSKNIRLSISMQIGLGLRETETSTAEWSWFKQRSRVYTPGKTKNKKTREIPVPGWLYDLLVMHWEDQGKPSGGLILQYKDDSEPIYRGFTKNAISSAGGKLGVIGLHPHRIRATFASAHFESGTTVSTIMNMLGHKHERTTFRYIERRSKDATEAQNRVASLMGF